jgi:hypothetical protein
MRLMLAGIFDGLALVVVIGLADPSDRSGRVANVVATTLLVPAALISTWSWWTERPATTPGVDSGGSA